MDVEQHRAKSQYRQLRLVITQELSGLVTYRLHGKEYEEDWNDHTLLLHGQIVHHESIAVLEDAISLCLGILQSQLLPVEPPTGDAE